MKPSLRPAHPSMERLLSYAKEATAGRVNQVDGWAGLGNRLRVSAAVITNWKRRGLSKEGAIAAEREFRCSVQWLLFGTGPRSAPVSGQATTPSEPDTNFVWTLAPMEGDLVMAFRALPEDEQLELLRDVMAQAERYEDVVRRELARRGIEINSFVPASRAAQALPPAPSPYVLPARTTTQVNERKGAYKLPEPAKPRTATEKPSRKKAGR